MKKATDTKELYRERVYHIYLNRKCTYQIHSHKAPQRRRLSQNNNAILEKFRLEEK